MAILRTKKGLTLFSYFRIYDQTIRMLPFLSWPVNKSWPQLQILYQAGLVHQKDNEKKDLAFTPKDPAGGMHRRKVFYPCANPGHKIEIEIRLKKSDIDHLEPDDIDIAFGPETLNEEIATWKDIYGIEERYKAKCCSENDGKYWVAQVLDEWHEDGRSPADYLATLTR